MAGNKKKERPEVERNNRRTTRSYAETGKRQAIKKKRGKIGNRGIENRK
jgi:hypothetical protein